MLRIDFPDDLKNTLEQLDEQWLEKVIKQLPFPIAYPLNRAKQEGYPWHQMVKDLLNAILHYMALLSISEYVASKEEPDFDINEVIQERIGRSISEGHWLSFIRICVKKRDNKTTIPLLNEIFYALEEDNVVKMTDEELNINTGRVGLLSSWIKLRNESSHRPELSEKSKKEKMSKILKLVKSVLYLLQPLSQYHYCQGIIGKTFAGFFDLTGIENFKELKFTEQLGKHQALLIIAEKENQYLPLFPLYISYKGKKGIIIEDREIYLITTIEKQKPSEYMSPTGSPASPKELKEHVIDYFNRKRMYERRQDIELAGVYTKGKEKSRRIVEELTAQGLYIPDKYVEREEFDKDIEAFLSSDKKSIIISGESGSGKTSSLIHWARNMLQNNELAYVLRCEGLLAAALNPDKLERTLTEELGYKGSFEEIIDWFEKKNKRFCLIFEGMNEFVGPGKDLGWFFESINTMLSRYRDKKCLKILISTTSETIPYFLNEQKVLPESMAEEKGLYFHGEEEDIYEFRKFNELELKVVAKNYDVPYWAVEEVRKNKKIDLLNPRQFRIFAELFKARTEEEVAVLKEKEVHQKIVNEMLKYSGYKLAGKHIDRALRKDKKLLMILEEMARFMHKQKDLSPTWARYEEKNPKLALMLKENNWEKLRNLKELQLIKEERISGSESIGDWKLSFRHDKVYDFLSKKNKKKTIILQMKLFVFVFLLAAILFSFGAVMYNIKLTFSKNIIETTIEKRSKDLGMVSVQSLEIYKELLIHDRMQIKKVINHMALSHIILIFMICLFLFVTTILPKIMLYLEKLFKKRIDNRVKYLLADFELTASRSFYKYAIPSIVLVFLVLITATIKNIALRIIIIYFIISSFALFIVFVYISLRNLNKFIRNSQFKNIFKYHTDKFALIYSIFMFLWGSFISAIFLFSLYNFSGYFKPLTLKIEYLDADNPSYSELIEKKWISKDMIKLVNEKLKKVEEKYKGKSQEYFKEVKFDTILLYVWLFITIFLTIPIIHVLYLRKKLGPYLR